MEKLRIIKIPNTRKKYCDFDDLARQFGVEKSMLTAFNQAGRLPSYIKKGKKKYKIWEVHSIIRGEIAKNGKK